ncbi:MAG: hypothetical protein D6728_09795, partial [Cyanobacteria bacterium J055]
MFRQWAFVNFIRITRQTQNDRNPSGNSRLMALSQCSDRLSIKNWTFGAIGIVSIALGVQSCQFESDPTSKIDDTRLTQHLQSQNWRAADAETLQLILK